MAVNLSKGSKISLDKVVADAGITGGLQKLHCGLGWDTNKYDGGSAFDLDASLFLCGADGKVSKDENFIFYKNLEAPGVKHLGDNRTGDGDGDDEVIEIDLASVSADVDKIAVAVTIYASDERKQNFGMVCNAYIRLADKGSNTELVRYDLGEDYSIETAIVVAEFYRHNGEWKFNAIGSGFGGGLPALCTNYGLSV